MPGTLSAPKGTAGTAIGLLVHYACFWGGVSLLSPPAYGVLDWSPWYLAGVVYLLASHRQGKARLSGGQCARLLLYSCVVAVWFWGATFALDTLGNSVQTRRLASVSQDGPPLHLLLLPGLASIAVGAFAAALCRSVRAPLLTGREVVYVNPACASGRRGRSLRLGGRAHAGCTRHRGFDADRPGPAHRPP